MLLICLRCVSRDASSYREILTLPVLGSFSGRLLRNAHCSLESATRFSGITVR